MVGQLIFIRWINRLIVAALVELFKATVHI